MNSKVRAALLFVVLFVIASTSLFAQSRAFTAAHITVSLLNPGPGGATHAVIGTTVQVSLEDPDLGGVAEIATAEANFAEFGAPAVLPMMWDAGDQRWKAEYTVAAGTLNGAAAKVRINSTNLNGDYQSTQDDVSYTVNNLAATLDDLVVNATITNPGITGAAIVGSTIVVSFTDAGISSASADFTPFGGGVVPMLQSGDTWGASYTVVAGTVSADLPVGIIAFEAWNPNPGTANSNVISIDNILPSASDFIAPVPYLSVTTLRLADAFLNLGESLQVHAKFNSNIVKAWIDWSYTFASGTLMEYDVVNGDLIDAIFTPTDGDLVYSADLTVKIVTLQSAAGNTSDPGFEMLVSGNEDGNPIVADLMGPSFAAGDHDLYFDNDPLTGWLRFSPNSIPVAGYPDTPDHMELKLDLANWGAAGDLHGLQLRFEAERSTFVRDYEVGSTDLDYTAGTLTISWDGKNDLGDFVANGTYGVTLWKVWDESHNEVDLSSSYYIADEYPGHTLLLDGEGYPQVVLNRVHVVVDNSPMEFARPLTLDGPTEFVRTVHTDHFVGDVLFPDVTHDEWTTAQNATLSFQARRDFIVDTNPMRREWGYHWTILTEDNGDTWYWNPTTSAWVSFLAFDPASMAFDLTFASGTAQTASVVNFVWNALDYQPAYTTTAGDYERNFSIVTFMKDNAGNVSVSDPISLKTTLTVTEATYTANLALVTDVEITTEHNGGVNTLDLYDLDGDHNFYLKAEPYYPASLDSIMVTVTINDKSYLRPDVAFTMDLSALGLGVITKTADDFSDDHKVTITISKAQMNAFGADKAGAWIFGPDTAANYLPITVISGVTLQDLSVADYPSVSTVEDEFNLVVPPAPVYPTPGTVVAATDVISPGHASWTYNAQLNPANDGIVDETTLTINVPASTYPLVWNLSAVSPTGGVWSKTGTLAADTPLIDRIIPFQGLTNDLQALVDQNSMGVIDVELEVTATQFDDDGYEPVEDQITTATITIDNVNPYVVASDGYTYDHSTRTVSFDVVPVVSNLSNVFEVVLKTNEVLRVNNLNIMGDAGNVTPGWSAAITDANGDALVIGLNTITATVLAVSDLGDNTYGVKVQVNGIDNPTELLGNQCILRLPWDNAGNPGRYNDPIYPVAADLFGNDSSEINFAFDILGDRPWISKLEFTHFQSVGNIEFSESRIATQGYIGNVVETATVKAWISGLNNRAIVPNYALDLSALPGAVIDGVPVDGVDGTDKTITWTLDLSAMDAVNTLVPYVLTVNIESTEELTTTPVYYSTSRSITILGDAELPLANTFSFDGAGNNVVNAGGDNNFQFSASDLPSGMWWDAAGITVSFSDPDVVLNGALTFANPLVSGVMTVGTDVAHFIATFTVTDNVGNEYVIEKHINVLPSPVPSNVQIVGNPAAPAFFRPSNDDITVTWDVSDYQRATDIEVQLWDLTAVPSVMLATVTLANDAVTHTFELIDADHTHQVGAQVLAHYEAYADADAATTLPGANSATSAAYITADGTDPDGLPVVVADAAYPEVVVVGNSYTFKYNVTDAQSGVDWTTAELLFNGLLVNPGITVAAPVLGVDTVEWLVTFDAAIETSRLEAQISISDMVANATALTRYVNVEPLPVVSNILITDLSPDNADPTNWFVPGHDLQISFDLDGHLRTDYLVIDVDADGDPIAQYVFDPTAISAHHDYVFYGVAGDIDGKVITATITGHVMHYADPVTGGDLEEPIVFNPADQNTDTISVDTKPEITISFHVNGDLDNAINYLLPNLAQMNNLQVMARVKYPNDLSELNEPVIALDPMYGTITFDPVVAASVDDSGSDRYLVYVYNVTNLDLVYSATDLYSEAMFTANTHTIYGYHADEETHAMVVLGAPVFDQYGVTEQVARGFEDVGRAPNGWFAPEHELITEYRFVSISDPATVEIVANFDRITDNVPENLDAPTSLTIDTPDNQPIVITLTDGRTLTLYPYLAVWESTPDYASVWNAYDDGEAIQIDYRFNVAPLTPFYAFSMVQVDKEVPTYEDSYYEIGVAVGAAAPVYETIGTLPGSDQYNTINLALNPPAPGTWTADQHVYLKLQINDGNGVGAGWVTTPVADGWTVAEFAEVTVGNVLYKEWKLSPVAAIDNSSILNIQLQQVEDLTGHKNYAGAANAPVHSNLYVADAPVITIGFDAGSDNGMAESIIAYQKFAGDELNPETSPYVRPGQNLGFQIVLNTTRAAGVSSIAPVLVEINDPTETDDANENWHALAQINPTDAYGWYLLNDLQIDPNTAAATLGLKYKVTYLVTYDDATTENKTFTSTWINTDLSGAPLIVIDRSAPQFVLDGVVVRSESSVTDNYVVPGENINITVLFTDESDYTDTNIKPQVTINSLNSFIDAVGPSYTVADSDISYLEAEGMWKAYVTGLVALSNPGLTSQIIVVTLTDKVGNSDFADKFVEIANHGPIVPLIRDAKYLTQLADGTWKEAVVEAVAGQSVNSKIEVYIDAEYEQYIDEVWIDVPAGVNITIPATYTIRPAVAPEAGTWVAVFEPVVATDMVAGTVDLVANTKRIPYNAEIFEHSRTFSPTVDIMDFTADTPVVRGESIDGIWIADIISPNRDMMIEVTASDLGEDFAADLPLDMSTLFTLSTNPAGLITTIPAPVISGTHTALWQIAAADIADLGIETATVRIDYYNIYGQTAFVEKVFNIDNAAPALAGMELHLNGAMIADYAAADPFFYAAAWDKIRVNFNDLPAVNVGMQNVDVAFDAHPLTYQYDPSEYPQAAAALASMVYSPLVVNPDGSGYVDISFTAPYAGTTLPNGRYLISVTNLTDMFGATVDLADVNFDWQYAPAQMTFYINGVANNNTVNVSQNPISIVANTSSDLAGLEGVEFRLYYDVDNTGTLTEPDLAWDLTSHLDPATDMVFPYDTYWHMDADEYKFVGELPYSGTAYRGFILRASAITQTRDLYNYEQLIMVTDDVAPVAQPDLLPISQVFDYQNHANNTLNIPVDFVDRDVVRVVVNIYDESGALVDTMDEAVADPSVTANVAWDFDAFAPANYTTDVTAWDFTGNNVTVAGPAIEIINAISMAESEIKIWNRIGINTEDEITGMDFSANPIAEYLIVESLITNPATPTNPLNGIAAVSFVGEVVDRATGNVVATFDPVVNVDELQNHNFVGGQIASHLILIDGNVAKVRLAVNNDDIVPFMAAGTDRAFRYSVVFHPEGGFTGIDMPAEMRPFSWFTVDQLAPAVLVANTSAESPVSWADGHQASFQIEAENENYDTNTEITAIELQWSMDGTTWTQVRPLPVYDAVAGVYNVNNWRIQGGNQFRYLGDDYEGPVQIRAQVTDKVGNIGYAALAADVLVDNKGPETLFTHVSQDISYPATTAIAGNEISIINDQTDVSELRLYVDAAAVSADAVLPLTMRQLRPGFPTWEVAEYTGDLNADNMYEFVIPVNKLENGMHRFAVVMNDVRGNLEGDTNSLTQAYDAFLDDTELENATDLFVMVGPKIVFSQIGNAGVVSEIYSMIQDRNDFTGVTTAGLASTLNVNNVGFEYSATGLDPWTAIDVATPVAGTNDVSVNFTMPALRAPILYLKATAFDADGRVMSSGMVQIYEDAVATSANVVALVDEYEGKLVIDQTQDLEVQLTYNFNDLEDVARVRIQLIDSNGAVALNMNRNYDELSEAANTFFIPAADLAALADDVYRLEVIVRDFADNVWKLSEDTSYAGTYDMLYIDNQAPANLAIASTSHLDEVAPYDATIDFRVNYTDLIAFAANDAFTATFTYQNATDVVSTYTVDEANGWIDFSWTPEDDFRQYILDGELDIVVDVNVSATDLLGHNAQLAVADFFTLTYGVPNTTKIMVVTDYVYNVNENPLVQGDEYTDRIHYVDWNLATPQVTEVMGTNQSEADPNLRKSLDLYAYLAHQSDIPAYGVEFYWFDAVANTWNLIGTDMTGNQWPFVHEGFMDQNQREYSMTWDVYGLPTGDYQVKTVSRHMDTQDPAEGASESIITVHLYNGTIVPNFAINGALNNQVERGETYTLELNETTPFTGDVDVAQGVTYMYRYVDADNGNSPVSEWMHFGDAQGTFITNWIPADYSFDWTVYPYYLYNNSVQIIAFARDQWGTETPLANVMANSVFVEIINTLAPAVNTVNVAWDATVNAGGVAHEAVVTAMINTSSAPQDLVTVEFFHKLDGAADYTLFDTQSGWTPAQMNNDLLLVSAPMTYANEAVAVTGDIKVVTTDIFGNTNEDVMALADLPAANFAVTLDGVELTTDLERESTVVLDANPVAAALQSVEYFWAETPVAPAAPAWNAIDLVDADPWTLEWDVPQNWTFGASYMLKTEVTDLAGNSFSHARSFVITDHTTDIVINTVAGIVPTSIGIIEPRLHGDNIPVAVTVNDPAIPRVEYMIRGAQDTAWTSVAFENVVNNPVTHVFDALTDLASGEYYIGVRASQARTRLYPVIADSVLITVDNDIAVTVNSSIPETNGFFNGENFVVNFSVDSDDEILENNVALEYNTANEPVWMPADIATFTTENGIDYTVTFANVNVPVDGYYNFRIIVQDSAVPTANFMELDVAQNIMVDSGIPIVAMVSINGETDLTLPVDIELGTQASIVASAYDIAGGQIHLIASGIERVEFLSDGVVIGEAGAGVRNREAYTFVWDTTGFEINTVHQIQAVAYDFAGNNAGTAIYNVNIIAPVQLQAYAVITAMEFDNETSNNDVIYAVVKDWPNTGHAEVTFEYYNGTAWNYFATAVNQGEFYSANFNAELMNAATAIRALVNGNNNEDSIIPVLQVTYNNGIFEAVNQNVAAEIFYLDKLHVEETFAADPIVTAIHRTVPAIADPVHMNDVYTLNEHQVSDIEIPAIGTHTYWAAVLDGETIHLNNTQIVTTNQGTASENGISFFVPAGDFGYFQDVEVPVAVPTDFAPLSPQHAFFLKDQTGNLQDADLTIAITPGTTGTMMAMTYDALTGLWSNPMNVIDNGNGTVTVEGVPSGTIVSVFEYTGDDVIHAHLSSIEPAYNVGTVLWTATNPLITFVAYNGMNEGGYLSPGDNLDHTMYLDGEIVNHDYDMNTGLLTYQANGLAAGEHTILLVVERDGFFANAEQTFNVDITAPVITAIGSQITATNRAITATITDTETGVMDVLLNINGEAGFRTSLTIPMSSMIVAGNTYTYNITDEDLFAMGYNFSNTAELTASWSAMNNLEMQSIPMNVNYTVNIVGPGIVFTGFEDGWWINPTQNTPLTFNVIAPAGREIQDNLMISLEELINDPVNGNYENLIQEMQLSPVSVNGNVYSYSVNFGYSVAPNAHAVRMSVVAEDNYSVTTMSQQTYGIDYLAPIVWAVSPVGAPINPEAFPVTYESAVIPYGTPVTIAVGFQDMQGFATQETGEWYYVPADDTWHHEYLVYYTGASGLNLDEVAVTLDGTALNGTISGGAFTAPQSDLAPGLHTVVATVADNAGNVGTMSYSFTVTGGAPSITFTGLNGDANNFWINSTNNNVLGFTVQTQGNVAVDTVVANIYAEPSNTIIQGPITPAATGNAYSINLLGGIVPAGSFAVRLEVTVSTVLGTSAVSNQTYGIDNDAPMITLTSPAEASVFAQNALVNILATISDQIATKGGVLSQARNIRSDRAGSGLNDVQLKVFTPSGIDLMAEVDVPVAQVIAESISGEQTSELGTYTIVLIATDGANNQSMVNRTFMVAPATGPAVSFIEFNNGWLHANQMNNLQFNVTGQGISSVSASVYANPSEALLMGPLAVNPSNGVYTVGVNGNMIPADQTSIRLEVTVNDQYGNETVANYYYNIDKMAPVVTILNPAEGAEITRVDETTKVVIEAQFSDMMPGKKAASGSGIASSRLVVIGPDGTQIGDAVVTGAGITETSHQLNNLAIGAYVARVTVIDNAGNQAVASVNFTVVDVPAPPAALEITDAHAYPNPASAETGARFVVSVTNTSTVSVRIYDFAGREVRSMNYAGKTNGKSTIEIVFDGRNNDGVKLARGTYFARVMANDGMKTVEKVVKIAIRK